MNSTPVVSEKAQGKHKPVIENPATGDDHQWRFACQQESVQGTRNRGRASQQPFQVLGERFISHDFGMAN